MLTAGTSLLGMPAWELSHFIQNANNYATVIFPGIIMILGVAGVCWGLGLLIKGWMGGQQSGPVPYGRAIALLLVGGAAAFGTWKNLYRSIGSGSQHTITNMGGNAKETKAEKSITQK